MLFSRPSLYKGKQNEFLTIWYLVDSSKHSNLEPTPSTMFPSSLSSMGLVICVTLSCCGMVVKGQGPDPASYEERRPEKIRQVYDGLSLQDNILKVR